MFYRLILALVLLAMHATAYYLWQAFTKHEVAENARLIEADGSADTLRAGFHQRRGWVRFWPWLGVMVGGAAPAGFVTPWAAVVAGLSLGILLAGFFARYFTPWLNVAMGLAYKPDYYASHDSASWPDAAVWKQVRAEAPLMPDDRLQGLANMRLSQLLNKVWLTTRLLYAAGMLVTLAFFLYY